MSETTTRRRKRVSTAAAIKQTEIALIAQLEKIVPESLHLWFKRNEKEMLEVLVRCGRVSRTYQEKDATAYGCTDLIDLSQRLGEVEIAWEGTIRIAVAWSDSTASMLYTIFEVIRPTSQR
jgi:hypothetical protein